MRWRVAAAIQALERMSAVGPQKLKRGKVPSWSCRVVLRVGGSV
jgi:hypothetical protein